MTCERALDRYIEATNTHNFDAVMKLLHPQAIYWFTDRTCASSESIREYFEESWNLIEDEVYSISDVQWLVVSEQTATCLYTYHFEGYSDDGFVSGSGRATNVFIKDHEQKWKLIHEHLSSIWP